MRESKIEKLIKDAIKTNPGSTATVIRQRIGRQNINRELLEMTGYEMIKREEIENRDRYGDRYLYYPAVSGGD